MDNISQMGTRPKEDELPLVLTVAQTAQVLQLGKPRVYELVHSKKLHSLQIGRKIRIPKGALMDFLNSST